jgi:tetratricopeptide (TPR) repeat protein
MLTDVSKNPIAETLRVVSGGLRSGDLQVRSGRMVKTAFFDHGRLVFTASNLRKDRLGEALVEDGRITEEEFNHVSALMRGERRRRFGEALVKAGVMDRYEVGTAVAQQVRRMALSFFELTDGAAIFEERECSIPLEYMISLSIHRLLYDGIRTMKNRDLIMKGLGRLDRQVVLAEVPPFTYEAKVAEEREVLEMAARRVTVRRLGWAEGGLTLSRLRATYALIASGILRDAEEAPTSQPTVQTETGMFLLSALHHRPDPSLREAIRKEVEQELGRSSHFDREAWLRVARFAPKAELEKALEEKIERYNALREGVKEDDPLRGDIEVILGRASSALRLAQQAPQTEPLDTLAGRRAHEEAASALEKTAPRRTVPPEDEGASSSDQPPLPLTGELIPVDSDTSPTEADAELETSRAEAAPAPGGDPTPDQTHPTHTDPGRRAGSVAAAPGASAFSGQAQVEHLLMEGEVRMTVSDYANAVKVYDKLVRIEPKVPAFRLRLAIAMACFPRTAKLAERQFFEASRLEPDNADIHYQWGLYYKAMKIKSRAVAEMRTAVRLNPRHPSARQELEALSPRDSALTSLKKLFR